MGGDGDRPYSGNSRGEIEVRLELEVDTDARAVLLQHWPLSLRDEGPGAERCEVSGTLA